MHSPFSLLRINFSYCVGLYTADRFFGITTFALCEDSTSMDNDAFLAENQGSKVLTSTGRMTYVRQRGSDFNHSTTVSDSDESEASPSIVPSIYGELDCKNKQEKNVNQQETSLVVDPKAFSPQGSLMDFHFTSSDRLRVWLAGLAVGDDLREKIAAQGEKLVLLVTNLYYCEHLAGIISAFGLYFSAQYSGSLCALAMQCVYDIVGYEPQASYRDGKIPSWLAAMKTAQTNWSLVINNEGFHKISALLGMLVSMGLCAESNLRFSINGVKLFNAAIVPRHASAVDLCDAVVGTITYFVEGGYRSYMMGSLKGFMFKDSEFEDAEVAYHKIVEYESYALTGDLLTHAKLQDNDFDFMMEEFHDASKALLLTIPSSIERTIVRTRMEKVLRIRAEFNQRRMTGGLRIAPYCVEIFGATGVGKSKVSLTTMVSILNANDFCSKDAMLVTLNESDKFMSNYRSYVNGVFLDDVGNTKAAFVEKSPVQKVIEIVNNVRQHANMADVDMKGKVSIEPKVCNITTNVKSLCAYTYSNEPCSIARRANVVMTVVVRPEFANKSGLLDKDLVTAHYAKLGIEVPEIEDLWLITLELVVPIKSTVGPDSISYEPLQLNGGAPCTDMSLVDALDVLAILSQRHFKSQEKLVEDSTELGSRIKYCKKCGFKCTCMQPNFGEVIVPVAKSLILERFRRNNPTAQKVERIMTTALQKIVKRWDTCRWAYITNWLPIPWMTTWYGRALTDWIIEREVSKVMFWWRMCFFPAVILGAFSWFCDFKPGMVFATCVIIHCVVFVKTLKHRLYERIAKGNLDMPLCFREIRDNYATKILCTSAILACIYGFARAYRSVKVEMIPQGNLEPEKDEDIEQRDTEVSPWASVVRTPLPMSEKSKTTVHADLCKLVQKNLCHMSYDFQDKTRFCDAFFVCSNVALIPQHMWEGDNMLCTFVRSEPEKVGANFKCILTKTHSIAIPNTDLSLVWVPSGGDWKDLSEYLPIAAPASHPVTLVYKTKEAEIKVSKFYAQYGAEVGHSLAVFPGYTYVNQYEVFPGMCMATLVAELRHPLISGFHLAGMNGTNRGSAGVLLLEQFKCALKQLQEVPGVLVSHSTGSLQPTLYDTTWLESESVHPTSPMNYLPHGSNVVPYGSAICRSKKAHSTVETSVISPLVEKHCGVPLLWGKPKFSQGKKIWREAIVQSANPAIGAHGSLVSQAVLDYVAPFEVLLSKKLPKLRESTKPLTMMQTLCGIDGLRFIDKIPPSTSIGFPLDGPKSNHLTKLDPELYPEFANPTELDPQFIDEFDRCKIEYLEGRRTYPIFKGCLKDEPTKLTKDKVRVFQAAPIVLQLFVRKYFLPIARVLSVNPLVSECAVGINAFGPEWDQMSRHVRKYGEHRILAGDYKAYDLKQPAQITMAAFDVLIRLAKICGYSDDDVRIMRGVATDVCYPLISYNGDLAQMFGSNPSGQNLTVYINSIANSLMMRCAFYSMTPASVSFRSCVALMTYGDDCIGSVREDMPHFNHVSVADYLASIGMVFTMPDKTSAPIPYLSHSDTDFLKRKNVWSEDLQQWVGVLDEMSIFKSLHAIKRGVESNEAVCAYNIAGALREFFFHGREVFDKRLGELRSIAAEADLSHHIPDLGVDFDARVSAWFAKYYPDTESV